MSGARDFDLVDGAWQRIFAQHSNPQSFWSILLESARVSTGTDTAYLFLQKTGEDGNRWQRVVTVAGRDSRSAIPLGNAVDLCRKSQEDGQAVAYPAAENGIWRAAVSMETQEGEPPAVIVVTARKGSRNLAKGWLKTLSVYRPLSEVLRLQVRGNLAESNAARLVSVLDLAIALNQEIRFTSAAMRICNEIASRHHYLRTSLGWIENDDIHLKALNHSEKFEKKMELVRRLEGAMEEALDQDEEIVWPVDENQIVVTREHAAYAQLSGSKAIVTVPIRLDGKPVGALCCERGADQPASVEEVDQLRLYADQMGRRLHELHRRDRWFGARCWLAVKELASKVMGTRHTGWKMTGALIALAMLVLVFGRMPYRVEASFTIRSSEVVFVSAPFEGYLAVVSAEVGERVEEGNPLARFDTRELALNESNLRAELTRYEREAEKARAESKYADMRIFQAQAEELSAELALIQLRLEQSVIRAPVPGFVIEGDLQEQIGAPFSKGDALFRISSLEELYFEATVDERDFEHLEIGARVEAAFSSRPELEFEAELSGIDPVALPSQEGNNLTVRCTAQDSPDWWRPGMTGIVKIESESRSFLWILTHRTVDFLRLFFWI